jgi:hypothetical protein
LPEEEKKEDIVPEIKLELQPVVAPISITDEEQHP